jgi:hypothetical protein
MGKDAIEERDRKPSRTTRRRPIAIANWNDATPATLVRAIVAAASADGALRFGYSRDGGAFAIGVYGDGDPYTDFVGGNEPIDEYLEDYVKLFEDIQDLGLPSAGPKIAGKNGHKRP